MEMETEKNTVEFEQVIEKGCGIDVHKDEITVSVQGKGVRKETRRFKTFTESLQKLKEWLKKIGITHIAMESTGVYWKPVYNILEEDFEILLVNGERTKNLKGHKTDRRDSKHIAKLLLAGLLSGSFVPPRSVRDMRDLTRYKRKIIAQISSEKNRIYKFLEDANIKLSSVVSNLSGATATKIIDAMLGGEEDVNELVKLRHGKMNATIEELAASLNGKITDHHRFMLRMIKKSIEEKEKIIQELDEQIDKLVKENEMELDVERLSTIPGVDKDSATYILSEVGNNMEVFPSEKHLASWAGMSPGNNESAGKKKVEK